MNKNALTKRFYSSDPFSLYRDTIRRLFGEDFLRPVIPPAFSYLFNDNGYISDYEFSERTTEDDGFTVYTKGDYPKLRILKELDTKDQLIGLNIYATIPGLDNDELNVEVVDQEITIECNPKNKIEPKSVIVNEIPNRHSKVIIGLSGPFEFDKINAEIEDHGLLRIHVPATPKPTSKKLPIKEVSSRDS